MSEISTELLERARGKPLGEAPREVREMLATMPDEADRRYTTTEPQDPGTRLDSIEERNVERAYDRIAENVYKVFSPEEDSLKPEKKVARGLKAVPGFEEAIAKNELGTFLANSFRAIRQIEVDNVHVEDVSVARFREERPTKELDGSYVVKEVDVTGLNDGTVVADKMTFTVNTLAESRALNGVLEALLVTPKDSYVVESETQGSDASAAPAAYKVSVYGLDEHATRSLARVVEATIAYDKKNAYEKKIQEEEKAGNKNIIRRIFKAPAKQTLPKLEADGETFPPDEKIHWEILDAEYQSLDLEDSYTKEDHLLITEGAAALQGMRDIMNVRVRTLPARKHGNPEQNPKKDDRLLVEKGIELTRDPVDPEEDQHGPKPPRTPRTTESMQERGREFWRRTKADPGRAFIEMVDKAPKGLLDLALKGGHLIFPAAESGKHLLKDRREWLRRKKEAEAAQAERDAILSRLQASRIIKSEGSGRRS